MKTNIILVFLGLAASSPLLAAPSVLDAIQTTPLLVYQETVTTTTTVKNPVATKPTAVSKVTESNYFIRFNNENRMVFQLYTQNGEKTYTITGKSGSSDYNYDLEAIPWSTYNLALPNGKALEFLTIDTNSSSTRPLAPITTTNALTLMQGTSSTYQVRNPNNSFTAAPSLKGSGFISRTNNAGQDSGGTMTGTIKRTITLLPKLVQQIHSSPELSASGTRPSASPHTLRQASYLVQSFVESKGYRLLPDVPPFLPVPR
jgi:hypothetical protein